MFTYTHVLNATTGERYYIDRAALNNGGENGYDETSNGMNCFEIDLQPENPDGVMHCGIDLVIPNDHYCVPRITRNLDETHLYVSGGTGSQDNPLVSDLVDTLVEGNTLIIVSE